MMNRDCCDRLGRGAESCCVSGSLDAYIVIMREPGRENGVPATEVMRRSRRALDGAIVAM